MISTSSERARQLFIALYWITPKCLEWFGVSENSYH